MLKGCWSIISGFLFLIGLFFILKDCGVFKPSPPNDSKKIGTVSQPPSPIPELPKTITPTKPEPTAELPKYKVTARSGFTINLSVPEYTPDDQIRALIHAFRYARMNKSLPLLIPPTVKSWYNGPYSRIFIQVFSDPDWATEVKLKRALGKTPNPEIGARNFDAWRKEQERFNREYNLHIRGEYVYETVRDNKWCESGSLGFYELGFRSKNYEELFLTPLNH